VVARHGPNCIRATGCGSYAVIVSSVQTSSSEYRAITEACGVLDRSQRGKLALAGGDAKGFLQGQVTNDVEALHPGTGCYAAFLTPKGKMLGDLRILDTGDELLLDTERVALQSLFNMIRRFSIGYDLQLHKRTLEHGLLSLIGPDATLVTGTARLGEAEHSHAPVQIAGVPARAIRTDLGADLLCEASDTGALIAALEEAGVRPVSEAAVECVRVESGRPRYGIDLDEGVIPQEAGLNERAVSFTKGCYVGQETVARLYYRGKPNRCLRGLQCETSVLGGEVLMLGARSVGRVGSALVSPRLGPIALALVRREADPGARLAVGDREVEATVVELPFA
jgi:tRNA-modifying protein YgfZ